jgi:UDP-4-amino-4,6-dideoxy-N-acetyl-beta-L-altrosamine transaminase
MIPYGRQSISEADIEAVVQVLRSDFLTQGPVVPAFERAVASYCGAAHAVAVNSATSALHLACLALDVGPGDRVWTSPITFVASANCARYCGAEVDFVDIDPMTVNMSVDALAAKLAEAEREGTLPKVVIPVHFAGEPCDMAAIHALGQRYNFRIIEDASHAIGARYRGEIVGACGYSDITVFSFHPVKIITTGEGGMATTNDAELARRMSGLRTHGITRDPSEMVDAPHGAWYYEQIGLGFNYRLTDLQAALGLSQLERLNDFVAARHRIAERYDELLAELPVGLPCRNPANQSALHLYVIQVDERERVFNELRVSGIGVNVHYIPVNRQPWHRRNSVGSNEFPNADAYYDRAISLPIYSSLGKGEIDSTCSAVAVATRRR